MRTAAVVTAFVSLLSVANCGLFGPSESLTGGWFAYGFKFQAFYLCIEQTGDTVSGRASGRDSTFGISSGGPFLFRDAPVSGNYPNVTFTVTKETVNACCPHLVGRTFSGKFDTTRDIVGGFVGTNYDIRFKRNESACGPSGSTD